MGTVIPHPPPLTGNVDPTKIEEIRRTVYVGNLSTKVRWSDDLGVILVRILCYSLLHVSIFEKQARGKVVTSFLSLSLVGVFVLFLFLSSFSSPRLPSSPRLSLVFTLSVFTLWLLFLSWWTLQLTAEQVLTFFQPCGEIKYVRMAGDETQPTRSVPSSPPPCNSISNSYLSFYDKSYDTEGELIVCISYWCRFAFVEFASPDSVPIALQYNGAMFGDRPVKWATASYHHTFIIIILYTRLQNVSINLNLFPLHMYTSIRHVF